MELAFETIGNATVICHDNGPVLATDPWLEGPAYFGSWIRTHQIPEEQMVAIRACKFLWISHGHPDHLCPDSLAKLRDKEILLPDHYGHRIYNELSGQGFSVTILKDGVWTQLSDRLRVASVADINQDAILLIDLGGNLILDANDSRDLGVGDFVRRTAANFEQSFLLCLTGYGDADMINFFDEQGVRIPPPALKKEPLGPGILGLRR